MTQTLTMQAAVCPKYGPPEIIQIVQMPIADPKPNEIRVKVMAAALNSGDCRVRGLDVQGWMKLVMRLVLGFNGPRKRVLGSYFSGQVETVGNQVTMFKPGDQVYGITGMKFGAHAQYLCIRQNGLVLHKPTNANHQQAAALPFGALTSMYFIDKHNKNTLDNTILVYGASGSVGTAAVQLAKLKGMHVTAVCSAKNVDLVKNLGADEVLAYDQQDITKIPKKFSLIFDTVGKIKKKQVRQLLNTKGKFFTVASLDVAKDRLSDLTQLSALFQDGKFKAIIDRTYAIDDMVAAYRYVDSGRKKGNVVITFPEV